MIVLGVDLETTGLDPINDKIIEIGAVLWDTEQNKPLKLISELIQSEVTVSEEITRITGITNEDLQKHAIPLAEGMKRLKELVDVSQYFVGHNGREFDKLFLDKACADVGISCDLPWIDTLQDIPYPETISSRKLTHLCAEHGFLNPFSHRAVFDVLSMLEVLSKYDFTEVEKYQQSPEMKLVAKVSYDDREKAKRAGFRWDPQGKTWYKKVKECQLPQLNFDFPVESHLL